tara:strand:- start:2767 stop:3624 length:858 start_codon:yes stop_codon:yes gene_type:complete
MRKILFATLAAIAVAGALSLLAPAPASAACSVANCRESGGARWTIGNGGSLDVLSSGELDVESGGALKIAGTAVTSTAAELNIVDGVTSTATELNLVDGSVVGNSVASKAALVDASKYLQTNANNGTPATNVTAVHYGDGIDVTAVLTVTNAVITVGNSADLGAGVLLYTLPAGNITVHTSYMELAIAGVSATTDTPDVGLGTVIASGAVTVLGGTATFEDVQTGVAADDTNGTAEIAASAAALNILTGGAHTIYFNAADGWGANADAAGTVNGTVVLRFTYNAP